MMTDDELLRYSRQIMLPDVDIEGQEKICAGRVAIIGLGGLGAPAAIYLASSGVGSLTLVDDDDVEISNLQRQIIHTEDSLNSPKVLSGKVAIERLNSRTNVEIIDRRVDEDEMAALASRVDVMLDATDNFTTRYALNRACLRTKTPLVSGAAIRMEGQISVFDPRHDDSPCYQCLYRDGLDEALNCAENGVLAPMVGIIGTMQAMEVLKLLGEFGESLVGKVIYFDAKTMQIRSFKLNRDPNCVACSSTSA
ncbi:MAG: molybdopterin-synthase adenylyltransferase MoeB [Gammaproteobacteria bacterium]|nr:molybdopterin-synthase adenylyltransferase MoeB [Gammaproteobacteria bacterium]